MAYVVTKELDLKLNNLVPVATPHIVSTALYCPWKYNVDFYLSRTDTRTPYNALTGLLTHYFIELYLLNHLPTDHPTALPSPPLPTIVFDIYKSIRASYEAAIQDTIAYGLNTEDRLYKAPELTRYYSLNHAKKYVEAIRYINNLDEVKQAVDLSTGMSVFYAINQAEKCYYNFLTWFDLNRDHLTDIKIEHRLPTTYLDDHPCSGTVDLLANYKGQLTVIDYKTSYQAYTEQELRNCAQMQWYTHFSGAETATILNLRTKTEVTVQFNTSDKANIKKIIKNKIKSKRAIDKMCIEGKIKVDAPNPLGTRSYNCPCPLLETKDKETRCIFTIGA